MNHFKHITYIATALCAMASLGASAQYKLPASHENQHNRLMANQRPVGVDIKTLDMKGYLKDLHEREREQGDEMFNYNWDSQNVNAYTGVDIPDTHNIDVRDYVAPVTGRVTSNYGWRPRFGRMHRGIDLALHVGDTVVAAFDGKVRLTRYEGRGYGYYVVVRHDNGLETVYGHLSRFLVKPDQRVKAGEPIALGGNTGRSTGPHLHFETRFLGLPIDPASIINFETYTPHSGIFTFERSAYEKSQKYGRAKKSSRKKSAVRKKSSTTTASAARSTSGKTRAKATRATTKSGAKSSAKSSTKTGAKSKAASSSKKSTRRK